MDFKANTSESSQVLGELPSQQVVVKRIVRSRYEGGRQKGAKAAAARPQVWDQRFSGVDEVELTDGRIVHLVSDGQQSCPQPGWSLILYSSSENPESDSSQAFRWTLYGIPAQVQGLAS